MPGGFYDKSSGIQTGGAQFVAGATIGWAGRAQLTSPADGVLQLINAAGTNAVTNKFILGTNDANGVCMRWTANGSVEFDLADASNYATLITTGNITLGPTAGALTFSSRARLDAPSNNNVELLNAAGNAYAQFNASDYYVNNSLLTAGTMTSTNGSALGRVVVTRFDWTNAMVTALGASTTGDIAVCTLPAKTVVLNAYMVVGTAETALTGLTGAVGRTSALYIDYIVASNLKAAANTVYGDASGERGTNLTGYDMPSFTGTTLVNLHLVSSVENLSTAVACTGSVYLITMKLP